jgi:tetratricopeptide (TPR) repeat protein
MKIKFLMLGLLGFVSATALAQKGEVSSAQSNFDTYEAAKSTPQIALPKLASAKTSIDKAAVNEKTAALPQTFALKGAIYATYAEMDTVATTSLPLFNTAAEALKKAKELDTKGEYKKLIENGNIMLASYQLKKGVKEFQGGKYDLAYKSFDFYRTVLPEDTNAIYYTGLAAINSGNYPAAITHFSKLVTTKFSGNDKVYLDLSSVYLTTKDTATALKTVGEGITKYPANAELRKREIEIALQSGRQKEVVDKIQTAISNDPKNKTLYYYAGLIYSQSADGVTQEIIKAKDPAVKTVLQTKKTQDADKAIEMYKKALELDSNYFEANLNLGYVLIAPAIETYNAANKLPANKQKEYDAAILKSSGQFDKAKPYLLKAVELNPKSQDALMNLLTYYKGKKDDANAAKINNQIKALK